jgi:CBS domain-containing protein
MTTPVVTVDRDAEPHDIARALSEHRTSGVPVVDATLAMPPCGALARRDAGLI